MLGQLLASLDDLRKSSSSFAKLTRNPQCLIAVGEQREQTTLSCSIEAAFVGR